MSRSHVTSGGPGYSNQPLSLPTCLPLPGLGKWGRPDVVATLRRFRKGESPSLRTSSPHPGGRPTQPAGRIPAPVCRLGVFVGTRRPALTPGGGRDPSPQQGRRYGAVPREGLQGPRTKRPRWGRRASGRRLGREITFWRPSGWSLSARFLFRGDPLLAKGRCWGPTQRPPPRTGLHICPSFPPAPLRGPRGPAFPSRGSSTKPGRGRGRAIPGCTGVEAARPGRAQHGHAPLRGEHNFSSPEVGFLLLVSGVLGPTSRNLSLPAWPGSPRAANGKPAGLTSARPRPRRSLGPSSQANAPSGSRAGAAAPRLDSAEGAGRRGSPGWLKFGSAGGSCGCGHCILSGPRREA